MRGRFEGILTNREDASYRGDHLLPQVNFIYNNEESTIDYIGRYENFAEDIRYVLSVLNIDRKFDIHINKGVRRGHYSKFYTPDRKELVEKVYKKDIMEFSYAFEDRKGRFHRWKSCF
jgi:hypothetical protein